MIFYALLELAHRKAFGIVQNVYLMGAPITVREQEWGLARSTVSVRFVNGTWLTLTQRTPGPTGFSRTCIALRLVVCAALPACIL